MTGQDVMAGMRLPMRAAWTGLGLWAAMSVAFAQTTVVDEGFDVQYYQLTLQPNLTTSALTGTEVIRLKAMESDVAHLTFSANALAISNATLDGQPVAVASNQDGIRFDLPKPLRAGQTATLKFEFSGTPGRGVQKSGDTLYTSYFACDWMVCLQDAPGDKADFALDLVLPKGVESLGVGRQLPRRDLPDGNVLHRWRSTRPYSPYLYGFAAGRIDKITIKADVGEFVYLDGIGSSKDLAGAFAETPRIAAFFADKSGVPLPDGHYVQLLVAGGEAQEAATYSLIGADELDQDLANPEDGWIIAHELAHQWWGNLVTCASWQEFWLNEGITTFMSAAWKEHAYGAASYRAELDRARTQLAKAREQGFDKPLAWAGKYPSLGLRRAVQYGKGALFLDHLRTELGEDAFWRGIKTYTRRHAGGIVTSRDFQRAMEEAGGRDLQPLFDEWVYAEAGTD